MTTESISTSFYDSVTTTGKETYLFQMPLGFDGKPLAQTNMRCGGLFPFPNTFLVKEIGLISDSLSIFTLTIGSRVYGEYLSDGTRFIPIVPLMIVSNQNFTWLVVSDFFPQKVTVAMFGTFTRPKG